MDKWAEMHAFVAVVEHNGFAAAARALDLVPSAVSRLITHLEVRLGVRLLNRTTRRLNLTEAGERFYIRCKAILDEIDASEADVMGLQQVPKGRLRISCVVAIAERYMAGIMATLCNVIRPSRLKFWKQIARLISSLMSLILHWLPANWKIPAIGRVN